MLRRLPLSVMSLGSPPGPVGGKGQAVPPSRKELSLRVKGRERVVGRLVRLPPLFSPKFSPKINQVWGPGVDAQVELRNGERRQVSVTPLNADLLNWGTEPFVAQCPQNLERPEKLDTVRVACPQKFLSAANWQLVQTKPGKLLESLLPQGVWTRGYGLHAEAREACVIGFMKVPPRQTQSVLAQSGEQGVFFSLVVPKSSISSVGAVRWLPRDDKVKPRSTYLETTR